MLGIWKTVCMITLLLGHAYAQNSSCDYIRYLTPGMTYYVYNPGYPGNYSRNLQCRWVAICESGYRCQMDCPNINLPSSPSCSMDRFMVSRTGDSQMTSAEYYCGKGSLYGVQSTGQRLVIGLISARNSPGGNFYCQLTSIAISTTTPPPTPAPCNCGYRKVNRIVGGSPTKPNEFPMMAGVAFREENAIKCGGVITSTRHVMTAAHCVFGRLAANLAVIVGEHDLSSGSDSPATQGILVDSYVIHPQYSESNNDYDIAILTLRSEIQFSEYVGPVCLPFKYVNTDFTGAKVKMLGWGTLFTGGPTATVLQQVDVDVISQSQCRQSVPTLTNRQLCTYTPGKDACQDDSGGPLLYTDTTSGRLFSIGIISFGSLCASRYPGVNTNVPVLMDWIVRNTPANLCRIQ